MADEYETDMVEPRVFLAFETAHMPFVAKKHPLSAISTDRIPLLNKLRGAVR